MSEQSITEQVAMAFDLLNRTAAERDAARADLNLAKDCAMDAAGQRARAEGERDAARAEVERLTTEISRWLGETEEAHSNAVEQRDRAERAEAEVERLRASNRNPATKLEQERAERAEALGRELSRALNTHGQHWCADNPCTCGLDAAIARAREAGWLP